MNEFEKLGIDEDFNSFYQEQKIKSPTEVQKKVIPLLLKKESVVCRADTGTGKTLAYALPLIEKVKLIEDKNGPTDKKGVPLIVVVSPTKELASQIYKVFKEISHHAKFRTKLLGTTSQKPSALKAQTFEVLVATPNKLVRCLKDKIVSFSDLESLVFDEADQLFEMGFMKDISGILRYVEFDQTNINFFSATLPKKMEFFFDEKFAKLKLKKIFLNQDKTTKAKVETFNISSTPNEKKILLKAFLEKTAEGRGIIFVNQKNQLIEVEEYLAQSLPKLKIKVLHGGLASKDRVKNLESFRNKKAQVLLASDVAARGIDVKDLEWVFNYGLPKTSIYYLHRVGRVGRAGKAGRIFNLITHYDLKLIPLINKIIREQSDIDLDLIETQIQSKMSKNSPRKPMVKKKRVKQTKRTKLYNK